MNNLKIGLGFDDVLLVPKKFELNSRQDIELSSRLIGNIQLNLPFVSSNMLDVTESKMAISMARAGAVGIVHRFMSLEREVHEVTKVKRAENILVEEPFSISPFSTVGQAKALMKKENIGGLVVLNKNCLVGILTTRDVLFYDNGDLVKDVMTPKNELITLPKNVSRETVIEAWKKYKVEKFPLLDEQGNLAGLITIKDILSRNKNPMATKDEKGRLVVGASVGVKDHLERAEALLNAGADFICVDVAHGHMSRVINAIKSIKSEFDALVVAGNIATAEGARDLIDAGVDAVKVGIGSGSICTTRIVAGAGVPQITAIQNAVEVAHKEEIPIIADGGIKASGDIVKALAAGADVVMLGSILAGTDESPGTSVMRNGKKYKLYAGMASVKSNLRKQSAEGIIIDEDFTDFAAEGVESAIPYKGSLLDTLRQLEGGLRSGMSYSGAKNIKELWEKAEFIKVSSIKEGLPPEINFL